MGLLKRMLDHMQFDTALSIAGSRDRKINADLVIWWGSVKYAG
jgi:hypothetical protein